MKKYLLGLSLIIMSLTTSVSLFAQVKLTDSGVTKFYENGTRITYFKMAEFPNSPEMREFVSKMILENPDVKRVVIYRDGETFMYEAMQGVEPDDVVDAVNEVLAEYKANVGDFPPPSPQDYEKQKPNVKITPYKASEATAKGSVSSEMSVSQEKKVAGQEKPSSNLRAVPASQQPVKQQSNGVDSNTKTIEMVSPAKYNENNMNK